ncbi:hypothetical protein [Mesorhizobium sangaii]|uniref:Uncharacterized protein n=1 Tax=Mesorhizobium sangaii TaxID=505389 RepID=A0A841PHU1_9HYPH|nr:hypothetical protein [Mesorhizobium sangaii]MBB6412198.1 hypothetical protein [Mesorhizobium sangaii]
MVKIIERFVVSRKRRTAPSFCFDAIAQGKRYALFPGKPFHTFPGIALALPLLLAGCASAGGSFCAVEHPIRPAKAEVATLSGASVAAILAHNEKGQALCGWRP